jgi:MHS family proline/betaine transporter-like MFS transporter
MSPARIRSRGLSLGYNFGVTVFGGFVPFILTLLTGSTGSILVPCYYVLAIGVTAAISLATSRKVFARPDPSVAGLIVRQELERGSRGVAWRR